MNLDVSSFIQEFSKGKDAAGAFSVPPGEIPLSEYPPPYRLALLNHYSRDSTDKEMRDSEHGINGEIILGGATVWNKEEFSPWIINESTVVLGNLSVEGTLYIQSSATLFVAKDIEVESLVVHAGEVHCIGNIYAEKQVLLSTNSCIFSQGIDCHKIGLFGIVHCDRVKAATQLLSEKMAFRNYGKPM